MANVIGARLWTLDTIGVIVAVGTPVIVRKIVLYPAAAGNDAVIQGYNSAGVLEGCIRIKAGLDTSLVSIDFGPEGRGLNGFKLSTLAGGSIDIYIGKN